MQFLCFGNNTVKGMRGISVKSHSSLRLMESGHGVGPLGSAKKKNWFLEKSGRASWGWHLGRIGVSQAGVCRTCCQRKGCVWTRGPTSESLVCVEGRGRGMPRLQCSWAQLASGRSAVCSSFNFPLSHFDHFQPSRELNERRNEPP